MYRPAVVVSIALAIWSVAAPIALVSGKIEVFLKEEYLRIPNKATVAAVDRYTDMYGVLSTLVQPEAIIHSMDESEAAVDLRNMMEALRDGTDTCRLDTVAEYLDVYALLKHEEHDIVSEEMVGYLRVFGGRKFGACAARIESEFGQKARLDVEKDLDRFFNAALNGANGQLDDAQLYKAVKSFDIAQDVFNVVQAARVTSSRPGGEVMSITNFLNKKCRTLKNNYEKDLNIVNMASSLDTYEVTDDRLLKLNEYNRVCVQFQGAETRDLCLANIDRQLN